MQTVFPEERSISNLQALTFIFVSYVYYRVLVCIYVCVPHVFLVPVEARRAGALNHYDVSLDPPTFRLLVDVPGSEPSSQ